MNIKDTLSYGVNSVPDWGGWGLHGAKSKRIDM